MMTSVEKGRAEATEAKLGEESAGTEGDKVDESVAADLERLAHLADGDADADSDSDSDQEAADLESPHSDPDDPDAAVDAEPDAPNGPVKATERAHEPTEPDAPTASEAAAATTPPAPDEPLLDHDAKQAFLDRWNEIQIGFVDDPADAARRADSLITDVADAYREAVNDQRRRISAADTDAASDTEAMRLTVVSYRRLLSTMLSS